MDIYYIHFKISCFFSQIWKIILHHLVPSAYFIHASNFHKIVFKKGIVIADEDLTCRANFI